MKFVAIVYVTVTKFDNSLGRKVVLVGSSFIAMEIAAFLIKKKECESVTVVCGTRSKVIKINI